MGVATVANNAWGNIASAVAVGDTTISLTSGQGVRFPATTGGNWFYCTLIDASGNVEIVQCTGRNVDILTVTRAMDGTTAKAFVAGSAIESRLVARLFNVDMLAQYASRDGTQPMTGALNFGTHKGINVVDPTSPQDASTKNYVDTQIAAAIAQGMPRGAIVMFNSGIIPSGWALCNGASGTPNLYDRFMVAAGSGYGLGALGGEATHVLGWGEMPVHNHNGNTDTQGSHNHAASDGGHSHPYSGYVAQNQFSYAGGGGLGGIGTPYTAGSNTGTGYASVSISTVAGHYHNYTTNNAGSGAAHENRPPYYAIYFIQKMY